MLQLLVLQLLVLQLLVLQLLVLQLPVLVRQLVLVLVLLALLQPLETFYSKGERRMYVWRVVRPDCQQALLFLNLSTGTILLSSLPTANTCG